MAVIGIAGSGGMGNIKHPRVVRRNHSGIDAIEDSDTGVIVNGNSIIAPEGSRVYDISGRIMDAETLPAGIYIVNTPKGTVKTRI